MKRIFTLMVVLVAMASFSLAWGGDRDVFVAKCGSCHKRGGQAAPVNPADKAGAVWVKYFKRGRHPVDLSGTISPAEMAAIVGYLEAHAADSDQPEAAAIPK